MAVADLIEAGDHLPEGVPHSPRNSERRMTTAWTPESSLSLGRPANNSMNSCDSSRLISRA